MTKRLFATLAISALCFAGTARAADDYKLDPIHSMALFQINHAGASNPFGVFHAVTGEVMLDDAGGVTGVSVEVPVEKLDMGNEHWEKHIESGDFLDAKQFPTITFKSTDVKPGGGDSYSVNGDLMLHGVTKSINVTVTKIGSGTGPDGKTRTGFSTEFKINRNDYGVTYLSGKGVGDDVKLMVNMEGIKQ